MRSALALLVLVSVGAGCRGNDGPSTPIALKPENVTGIWQFVRTAPSACVPDTLNVRLTTAFYSVSARDTLDVSGDWTSNRDARVRVFDGSVATSGGFLLRLTLNEGVRGTMDARGGAKGGAYCGDGTTAPVTGTRR